MTTPNNNGYKEAFAEEHCLYPNQEFSSDYFKFSDKTDLAIPFNRDLNGKANALLFCKKPLQYLARLENVSKVSEGTIFIHQSGKVLWEHLTHRDYDPGLFLRRSNIQLENFSTKDYLNSMPIIDRECIFLGLSNNFGHYLHEYLGRVILLKNFFGKELCKIPIVIYKDIPKRFIEFTFKLAKTNNQPCIFIPKDIPLRFANVWVPSCTFFRDSQKVVNVLPDVLHSIRHSFKIPEKSLVKSKWRKIYLARVNATQKRIINEKKVVNALESIGFESMDLSTQSLTNQIEILSQTKVLIGPIGANTSGSVFAPSDCSIIELVGNKNNFGAYNSIITSNLIGQPYHRYFGNQEILKDNPFPDPIEADFRVDLGSLLEYVKSIGV
jgi:hypothetical protein